MFEQYKKSIAEVLGERTTSPFYGSFILSWSIFNWKILYLTIFVGQDLIKPMTKIQYIDCYYSDWKVLILYPLLSSIFLVTILPWFANKLFEVYLYYDGQRRALRERAESERMIPRDMYMQLRNEMAENQSNFERDIEKGGKEIAYLKEHVRALTEQRDGDMNVTKVLYGEYRTIRRHIVVTDILNTLVMNNQMIKVINETFAQIKDDIDPGEPKELFFVYREMGEIKTIRAKEHSVVRLDENYKWVAP